MKKYAIGVDIGGMSAKLGLFETDGKLVDKWSVPTSMENEGKAILPDIAQSIFKTMEEKGIPMDQIQGVGVGVPGPVLQDGSVNRCINLGWGRMNIKAELEKLVDLPVMVANDANVAALGEIWMGAAKGMDSALMVTLGTGVGGGLIINQQIVHGADGAAAEIGHITVNPSETLSCNCGKKGCLEQYASATGILRRSKEKYGDKFAEVKDIYDAAKAGDQDALDIVEETGHYLGQWLGTIACVANPQIFIIGGGVSMAGEIVTDSIKKYYGDFAFHASKDTPIVLAKLGNDAGIYGCARMVIE